MNPTDNSRVSRYHWALFIICFLGTAFAGVISTLMSVYLPVAVKDLLGSRNAGELDHISAYINAVFIFGGAVGGFLSGIVSDRAGRKAGVILSIACYGLFTILTGYMPNWWGVVICRFFSGFGFGGILVTGPTIMVEEWPKKSRAIFIGILSIGIPVGIFSAGIINYFVSYWRQAFLVGIIPVMIAIIAMLVLKESENWKQGRIKSHSPSEHREKLFSIAHRANLVRGSVIFGSMLIGLWAVFSWIPTWIQSLITVGDGQQQRGLSMMMLGMGGLTGGFFSGWFINALGAKRSMLLCFAVAAIMSLVLFRTNHVFSAAIYVEIAILALFFGVSQGVLSVYIPTLFPVFIRGRATGFCFNTGRIFTATAVLFVGMLVSTLGGYANSLLVFSSVFIFGLVATYFSKTTGRIDEEPGVPGTVENISAPAHPAVNQFNS
ncbi:MAG TPA: MFS transporter [Chitinophagaceae bacterium]